MGGSNWTRNVQNVTEFQNLNEENRSKMIKFVNNLSRSEEMDYSHLLEKSKRTIRILKKYTNSFKSVNIDNLSKFLSDDKIDSFWLIRYILGLSKNSFELEIADINHKYPKSYKAQLNKIREDKELAKDVIEYFDDMYDLIKDIRNMQKPPTWEQLIYRISVAMEGSALKGQKTGSYLENKIEEILKKENIDYETDRHPVFNTDKSNITPEIKVNKKLDFLIPNSKNPKILIEAKMYDSSGGSKQSDGLGDFNKVINITNELDSKYKPKVIFVVDGRQWKKRLNDLAKFFLKLQNNEIQELLQIHNLNQIVNYLSEFKKSIQKDLDPYFS